MKNARLEDYIRGKSNMWHDNDKIVEVYNRTTEGINKFPCECPACNCNSVHVYIHDHGDGHCGIWAWCSECGAFSHMSGQTPTWWKKPMFIDGHELCAEPDYLEAHAIDIDEWVNSLIPTKKTKSYQPYVIEDRFNVIIKNDIQGILAGTRGVMVVKNDLETVKIQFVYEDGQAVDITISQEELLQAIEVLR
jgi:hypothetical protein